MSALVLRYAYLHAGSVPRLVEMIFWPIMDLLMWGFISTYFQHLSGAVSFLLGAIIMWDVLYRSQLSVSVSFLEDLWTRNLLNLFVAPLRLREMVAALCIVALARTGVVVGVMGTLALALWSFSLTSMGWAMLPLFANLLWMGCSLGLVAVALFLRYGQAADSLAWGIPFMFQPLSAVFYPVSSLPGWLQPLCLMLPSTQVFEGMRAVLRGEAFPNEHLLLAAVSNVVLMGLSAKFFRWMFQQARIDGHLARLGTE
ncbi:MAG TPA: ABC transporter permease [Candidatus Xenobia bacterium]